MFTFGLLFDLAGYSNARIDIAYPAFRGYNLNALGQLVLFLFMSRLLVKLSMRKGLPACQSIALFLLVVWRAATLVELAQFGEGKPSPASGHWKLQPARITEPPYTDP
jgi:hypothetical protein